MSKNRFVTVLALFFCITSTASAQSGGGTTTSGTTRVCSSKYAAKAFADSLVVKLKAALQPQVTSGAISKPSVRVTFKGPRSRPQKTTVDFAKEVTVAVDLAAADGSKIALTGTPAATTLYASCNAGSTDFTIFIGYKTTAADGTTTPTNIRQNFQLTLPGQFF